MNYPWLIPIAFRYHPKMVDFIKQIPGAQWEPSSKTWAVPSEMLEIINTEATKCKVQIKQILVQKELPKLF